MNRERTLAAVTALAFTAGALIILLGPALLAPLEWSSYHVLTVLTVFGTIAAGHLTVDATRARHVSALGFAALFLAGTSLVVYNSVGRQAETTDAKALDAGALNAAITAKSNDLADARQRLIKAQDKVELYTNGGRDTDTGRMIKPGCGTVCTGWKQNRSDLVTVVKTLERELAGLGPQQPVNAKAETFAEIAALFGFDKAKAVAAFTLLEPFLWTLFFEIGSIVSIGFAFRHRPATVSKVANDTGPGLPKLPTVSEFPVVDFHKHKVLKALESQKGPVSNARLAELLGETEGEASKSWREVARHLEIGRQGKELRIALRKTG